MSNSRKKIALVTGASGQDGAYLCEFLLKKKYKVIAADRRSARNTNWRFQFLNIEKNIIKEEIDLSDLGSIVKLFKEYKFDEVYNLAAQSFVKSSFNSPMSTSDINSMGVLRLLETIRYFSKKTKFYQASTSEMFGNINKKLQDETTLFYPRSPYAVSKVFAHHMVKNYRDSYGLFACSGILFNHESPLRGEEFVTRKIIKQATEVSLGLRKNILLGNIYSKRDWGFAKDYVEAMWLMLQQKKPDDYVIATEKNTSIKEFVNKVFKLLNLDIVWKGKGVNEIALLKKNKQTVVKIDKKFFRPAEVDFLKGSYKKAKKKLGWAPQTSLDEMIKIMLKAELNNYNFNNK